MVYAWTVFQRLSALESQFLVQPVAATQSITLWCHGRNRLHGLRRMVCFLLNPATQWELSSTGTRLSVSSIWLQVWKKQIAGFNLSRFSLFCFMPNRYKEQFFSRIDWAFLLFCSYTILTLYDIKILISHLPTFLFNLCLFRLKHS